MHRVISITDFTIIIYGFIGLLIKMYNMYVGQNRYMKNRADTYVDGRYVHNVRLYARECVRPS